MLHNKIDFSMKNATCLVKQREWSFDAVVVGIPSVKNIQRWFIIYVEQYQLRIESRWVGTKPFHSPFQSRMWKGFNQTSFLPNKFF